MIYYFKQLLLELNCLLAYLLYNELLDIKNHFSKQLKTMKYLEIIILIFGSLIDKFYFIIGAISKS
jgi:predicted membrane channel-forming protein YqfA (hemolysin III family)